MVPATDEGFLLDWGERLSNPRNDSGLSRYGADIKTFYRLVTKSG